MKKISLLTVLFAMLIAVSSCKKSEETSTPDNGGGNTLTITQEQKGVAFYMSGNWCGPCGLYGRPAMANLEKNNATKLVEIACHVNGGGGAVDPLNCADANAALTAWGVTGVPTCALGGAEQAASKIGGGTGMQASLDTKMASLISSTATANSSIEAKNTGGTVVVKTKTKFFAASPAKYYISAYVLENKIAGKQYATGTGWDNNAVFSHVLRKKLGTSFTGDDLVTAVTVGQEVSKEFTFTIDPAWVAANLDVAVVIWKDGTGGKLIANGTVAAVK